MTIGRQVQLDGYNSGVAIPGSTGPDISADVNGQVLGGGRDQVQVVINARPTVTTAISSVTISHNVAQIFTSADHQIRAGETVTLTRLTTYAALNSAAVVINTAHNWITVAYIHADAFNAAETGTVTVTQTGDVLTVRDSLGVIRFRIDSTGSTVPMILLPKELITDPGNIYQDMQTAAWWDFYSGNAVAADVVNFVAGTQSMKTTTLAGGDGSMGARVDANWDLSGSWQQMRCWVYMYNPVADYNASIETRLGTTMSANFYRTWITPSNYPGMEPNMWRLMTMPKNYFKVGGGAPNWASIQRPGFAPRPKAATVIVTSFDQWSQSVVAKPAVMFRFDDGYETQYTAYQYMRSHNLRGTLFTETGKVNTGAPYISLAHLLDLQANGWVIGNHTRLHDALAGMSLADQTAAIGNGKSDLIGWGITGWRFFAYPTSNDINTPAAAIANGTLLIGGDFPSDAQTATPYPPNVLPLLSKWYVGKTTCDNVSTLTVAKAQLDEAIAAGAIYCPMWHNITGVGVNWSMADFQAFVDYVVLKCNAGLLNAITFDDLNRLQYGPVSVPVVV